MLDSKRNNQSEWLKVYKKECVQLNAFLNNLTEKQLKKLSRLIQNRCRKLISSYGLKNERSKAGAEIDNTAKKDWSKSSPLLFPETSSGFNTFEPRILPEEVSSNFAKPPGINTLLVQVSSERRQLLIQQIFKQSADVLPSYNRKKEKSHPIRAHNLFDYGYYNHLLLGL